MTKKMTFTLNGINYKLIQKNDYVKCYYYDPIDRGWWSCRDFNWDGFLDEKTIQKWIQEVKDMIDYNVNYGGGELEFLL